MRIDENSRYERVKLADGTELAGSWALVRAVGSLGHAPALFAYDELSGVTVPISSVMALLPFTEPIEKQHTRGGRP